MHEMIRQEFEKAQQKRDELRDALRKLEEEKPQDSYNIRITQDRLAYWEGKTEGLKFALDHLEG